MTDFFEWDAGLYGINVPTMDREHEHLIGLMNAVYTLHTQNASRAALTAALGDLVAYTRKHFADEEAYMAQIKFPELRTHALIHQQLLEKIQAFGAEFSRTGKLTDELFIFLKMWLKAHICGIDAKYGRRSQVA